MDAKTYIELILNDNVSENPPRQGNGQTDCQPKLSDSYHLLREYETFIGAVYKNGWRPILLKRGNDKAIIIDWLCPCGTLIFMCLSCPKCGLGKWDKLPNKLDEPPTNTTGYKLWHDELREKECQQNTKNRKGGGQANR